MYNVDKGGKDIFLQDLLHNHSWSPAAPGRKIFMYVPESSRSKAQQLVNCLEEEKKRGGGGRK